MTFKFHLQWHLTDRCQFRCKHCYITHDIKNNKSRKDADIDLVRQRLKEFSEHANRWNLDVRVNFAGGDPLLHPDFYEIAEYNNKLGFISAVLGNPKKEEWEKIDKLNLVSYQISLDGLKDTHDMFRGHGAFDKAIESLRISKPLNVKSVVLATVTKDNIEEIPALAEYLHLENLVDVFDFARVVPTGEALKEQMIKPNEYRKFLFEMHNLYVNLKHSVGYRGGPKEPLWSLLFQELGYAREESELISKGCGLGFGGLSIDVDGTVYSCRRLEKSIGNINDRSIYDIFINSAELNKQRKFEELECAPCDLVNECRGCRAVAYHATGDYFKKDPQCWKNENSNDK